MILKNYIGKEVILELKDGSKRFGKITAVDDSPIYWNWIELYDSKKGKLQLFNDSEIKRIEEIGE
jgi:hypothetical protein